MNALTNALAICVNGGFLTADQKARLIAQGSSPKVLESIGQLRGRLLGGMRGSSEKEMLLSYVQQLIKDRFSEGKDRFELLLISLGAQDDPKKRCSRAEMCKIVEIGIEILGHAELSPEDFRSLLKNLLLSLTHFQELRQQQRELAWLAAQNELNDAKARPVMEKLPLYLNATYYCAKAFSIDHQNIEPLQEIPKIFMRIIGEIIAPDFEANVDDALRRGDFSYCEHLISGIPHLKKFQNSEKDYQTIQNLYKRAENVLLEFQRKGKNIPDSFRDLSYKIFQLSSHPYKPTDPTFPIREYRKALDEFRTFFEEKIKEIKPETTRLTQAEIHNHFLSFFNILLDDAFLILGPPPCKYDLRAYGSLSREEFCPYSDLESMILIEKEEDRSYFKTLAQLLSLQIISIGETAPANFPIFSATGPKHPSGFHVDSGGDPAQDDRLIGTPDVLARLQASSPGPDGSELPTDAVYSLRNTISLRATDPDLFTKYTKKIGEILDADDLRKKRAVDFLKFRLADYKKLFAENWRKAPILNLKKQFLELLYHPLSDLALYFGCQNLNTLDVIDKLPCFTAENRLVLKEAVFLLYKLRLKLHFHYGEQKEEASQLSKEVEGYIRLEEKEKFLLQAAYLLILCPFYSYLENLFSQKNFAIGEIALLDLAFEKACKESETLDAKITITHLAKFLACEKSSNECYYKQLSEKNLGHLREVYCQALQEAHNHLGNDFLKNLILSLEKIPDSSGNRLVLKRKREAFFQKLLKITSEEKISENPVQISSPFFKKRYLLPEVVCAVLDKEGHIKKQMQNTNSRVSSYEKGGIAFHFKEKPTNYKKESPFHPGREHAAAELMFRLFGRGTSISELFEIEVLGQTTQKYLVLVSETIPGKSPSSENPPLIDPSQLSELFLSLPLLLPGDMRPANLIATPDAELISVDNDVSWVKPYTKDGYNLYTILPFLYPEHILHPDAIEAFLDLKPVPLLTDWLTELIAYNRQMLSAFQLYEEIPESKAWFSYTYYTSTCCFERGTGAQLLLQFHQLQEFLRKNKARPIQGIEILQTIISMDQDTTVSVGTKIYDEYQKASARQDIKIADKVKEVTRRRANMSASMSASTTSFYRKIPQNKEELLNCAPEHALEEIEKFSILKINETNGISLKIGEFSSLHLQRIDVFKEIDSDIQRFLFKVLLLHQFEHLNLSYSCLNDTELKGFLEKTGRHLKVLDLRGCSNLTKKSIESLYKFCPILEELYLSRCDQIEKFSVILRKLKILHLADCPKLGYFWLHAPELKILKITGNSFLDPKHIALFSDNFGAWLHKLGKDADGPNYHRHVEALEYHQQALEMRKQLFKPPHQDIARSLVVVGTSLFTLRRYVEALEYYQQALEMRKQLFKVHSDIAASLYHVGISLAVLGRHTEALECSQQALEMSKQRFKAPHQDIVLSLNNFGTILSQLGREAESLEHYQQALEMSKQLFKTPHPDIVNALNRVSKSLSRLGRKAEAIEHNQQGLEMRKQLFKAPHPAIVRSLNTVGEELFELGRDAEALKHYQQALEMEKQFFEPSRRNIEMSLNYVGKSLCKLGRYAEALEYHQQALEIYKEPFKFSRLEIAYSLHNVGASLYYLGRYVEALEYLQQARQMYNRASVEWREVKVHILSSIAETLSKTGKYVEAYHYATEAFFKGKNLFTGPDRTRADILKAYGISLDGRGKYDQALEYLKQALEMRKTLFGEKHADVADSLDDVGKTLGNLGKHEEALLYHEEAFRMGNTLSPRHDAFLARSLHLGGVELQSLKRNQEALDCFKQALELRKALFKDLHPDVADSLKNIEATLKSLGRHEEALEYEQQALEMTQALTKREKLRRPLQEELVSIDLENVNKSLAFIIDEEFSRSEDLGESSSSSLEVSSASLEELNSDKGKEEEV